MSAHAKSAALRINWAGITSSLGLKGQTAAALQAFKKRNEDARRKVTLLREQPMEVDFSYYRSILKNQAIVGEVEKARKNFHPVTYDVEKQIKIIEGFEAEAVRNAEATKGRVDFELKELKKTLKNIEETRSFEDLTVDDIAAARPDIDARTAEMVAKGRWMPAGYKEKFGELSVL
ncbi:mitochondrial ATP synthase [Choiromyces venosus 120613-1]|uniref:ATP synthase subunit d, mitochondrial n=1 Tax=Choiromyces venosus 120613-1 TaxID=1336337 RepID=A0A3N4KIP5_9PEZI|nr:mitochondrial ATP synthase [Choiromyces venosus 120613-1]